MKNKALDSNLDFNGQAGTGVNGHGTNGRFSGNQAGMTMKENFGRGPTKGNTSSSPIIKGVEPKMTIATAAQGKNDAGGLSMGAARFSNPDKIRMGLGPRKGNA